MISVAITTDNGTTFYDVMPEDAEKVQRQIARIMDKIICRQTVITN